MTDRFSGFRHRVALEREILQQVNAVAQVSVPLAGLTIAAIDGWISQNLTIGQESRIVSLLRELSARLAIEADKSKQVFDSTPVTYSIEVVADAVRHELSEALWN